MNRNSVYIVAPRKVEVRSEVLPDPAAGQVLVRAVYSAISPGTEMLFYRGNFDQDIALDSNIVGMSSQASYPVKYGYSMVGEVTSLGDGVSQELLGRRVFVFQPHEDRFCTSVDTLLPVPDDITNEDAIFLPNMETAVNFVMDGAPLIGERVVIFGQGIVGLLTTSLLASFPLGDLVTLDPLPLRRSVSSEAGAQASLDPGEPGIFDRLKSRLKDGADLVYEVSGSQQALDQALAVTGFSGRVVIGSWYGTKPVSINLGGEFHRSRIRLLSSQVSTIDPELRGRWSKDRRYDLAWQMIEKIRPSRWITHQFSYLEASGAYRLIDEAPEETIQVMLTYL